MYMKGTTRSLLLDFKLCSQYAMNSVHIFLRKHEIDLSYHPAMQFLGIRTKDCVSCYRDICFSLFGACSIHNNQEMEKGVLCGMDEGNAWTQWSTIQL